MNDQIFTDIQPLLLFCTLPGGAGGIVLFLWSFKKGHYKNNKYRAKFCIEIFGAMVTATFVTTIFIAQNRHQVPAAFLIGIGWSGIIQMIRKKITKIVEAVIG